MKILLVATFTAFSFVHIVTIFWNIGLKGLIRRPIHSYVSAQSCYAKVGQ